ncbi:MAG TPA: multiheme c-type cytochrome [Limnobacter sp.]|nr:multiheme c-type cytochrome [Limnobacter sp.]
MAASTPMHRLNPPRPATLRLLRVLAMAGTMTLNSLVAQGQTMPHQTSNQSVGTVNCASSTCHGSIAERSATPVLQNEYTTWLRQDPHTQAYAVLKNAQSQRIARNLALPQPAHESKVCLDCHSHNPAQSQRGPRFDVSDGVNCEACHGPAEKWIKTHVEPNASHSKNIENGLYPTSDPYALAKLCSSCHVGDASRPITHQIMGAGHPRIALEVDTFMALQPPHYRIDNDWRQRKGAYDSAKIWAMGQFANAANLLDLIADPKRNRQGVLPELMMFDCHACHSSMRKTDWTPKLGASPGQARINNSSLLMVQIIARASTPELAVTLERQVQQLHLAATSPAARFEDLERAAHALHAQLDTLRKAVASKPLDTPALETMLRDFVKQASQQHMADFAVAEQTYMSMASINNALANKGQSRLVSPVNITLQKLLKLLANDEQYDRAAFQQALLNLQTSVGAP